MLFQGRMDIDVHRNAVFMQEFTLEDNDGAVVDLTGATLAAVAASHAGEPTVATATINITDATAGKFTMEWDGADFGAFGSTSEVGLLVYDLKMELDAVPYIICFGCINLIPGITP